MTGGEEAVGLTFAVPGTRVRFTDREAVVGVVLRTEIRGAEPHMATHEVAWWVGSDRKTAWVEGHEIRPLAGETVGQIVGFGG